MRSGTYWVLFAVFLGLFACEREESQKYVENTNLPAELEVNSGGSGGPSVQNSNVVVVEQDIIPLAPNAEPIPAPVLFGSPARGSQGSNKKASTGNSDDDDESKLFCGDGEVNQPSEQCDSSADTCPEEFPVCNTSNCRCVEQATCGNDVIELPDESCDGGDCCRNDCLLPIVFLTTSYWGDPDQGVNNGDALCQNLADQSSVGGVYRAWLSTSSENAKDRVLDCPYQRIDGALVANNKSDLTDGTLQNPINIFEDGSTAPSSTLVFTGTDASGNNSGENCSDWSSPSPTNSRGGDSPSTDADWTDALVNTNCNGEGSVGKLYCFEIFP